MLVDLIIEQTISWKDKLVGHSSNVTGNGLEEKEDFDLLDGGIQKSIVNDIPSIEFSDRIHQILIRDMDNTVILNLLGHNIGYGHVKEVCTFRVFESSTRNESPPSEMLPENQSPIIFNTIANGSAIRPVSSTKLSVAVKLINSGSSKGLRENNKNLRPSGLLGAKAHSSMGRAIEGSKKHHSPIIANDFGCLDENSGLDGSGNSLVTGSGGVNLKSFFAPKSVMEG
ncbi:hypothetical protein J1N35_037119 [Gossypium stocksii]|uniref:Uncharacterized protein n=1 Tax=Gossypium stocksii TaxID=47602 RepID=A0A9D3UJZ2_9ROSI|nr:hypothetical protein J1N35_037119 [Gossypium stocksii]